MKCCHGTKVRNTAFSVGNNSYIRQAMALFNLAFHQNGFFWDGRAEQLRDQVLGPIENLLEMNETLANMVSKLGPDNDHVA
ncbi:MAG: cytochrome-c peroxidase [Crocinitomicaceae bacterium]|nr:cytochrome-c peroxidase [Crocinitomicaceae bacterium]MDG2440973.1 cytochrome-c peroxidase [Crocinitomicaceae bacterium]